MYYFNMFEFVSTQAMLINYLAQEHFKNGPDGTQLTTFQSLTIRPRRCNQGEVLP